MYLSKHIGVGQSPIIACLQSAVFDFQHPLAVQSEHPYLGDTQQFFMSTWMCISGNVGGLQFVYCIWVHPMVYPIENWVNYRYKKKTYPILQIKYPFMRFIMGSTQR